MLSNNQYKISSQVFTGLFSRFCIYTEFWMRFLVQVVIIAVVVFFVFNPGTNVDYNEDLVACWNHHCDYGDVQLLCYRPLFSCDINSNQDNPVENTLGCIKSREGSEPKPDLYCSNNFFSDCGCAHRRTGVDGDLEPSDKTEHAYCKCAMNFRFKFIIVVLVVVFILLVIGLVVLWLVRVWFVRRKYHAQPENSITYANSKMWVPPSEFQLGTVLFVSIWPFCVPNIKTVK